MEKLLMKVTMRLPEDVYVETKQAADREHRPVLHQVRHFFFAGLEQYRNGLRKTETAAQQGMKPPQRATEWNGEERRGRKSA